MASIERHVTREVLGLDARAACREAAKLMAQKRIGAVAVLQGGKPVGLVSERDLVYKALLAHPLIGQHAMVDDLAERLLAARVTR